MSSRMVMTDETCEIADASSHFEVEKEARLVGIKGATTLTLGSVDRRRSQLWTLAFSGLVVFAVGLGFLTSGDTLHLGLANTVEFRIGTVVLVIALAAYVMDKEHYLRRLARMLVDERVPAEAMGERLNELRTLAQAANVEITESVLIEDVEHSLETLRALRRVGARISVDDFGTGYSSLAYLHHLPIDTLKIGQSFTAGIGTTREGNAIVETVVSLAKSLSLKVLAEGIQTDEQAAMLRVLACDYGQGFFWGRPTVPGRRGAR